MSKAAEAGSGNIARTKPWKEPSSNRGRVVCLQTVFNHFCSGAAVIISVVFPVSSNKLLSDWRNCAP